MCTVPACEWADIRTADVNQDFGADVRWRISRCTRFTTLRFQARVFVVASSTDVWSGSCPALFLACAWAFFRVSGPTCWAVFLDALFEIRFIPSFLRERLCFVRRLPFMDYCPLPNLLCSFCHIFIVLVRTHILLPCMHSYLPEIFVLVVCIILSPSIPFFSPSYLHM